MNTELILSHISKYITISKEEEQYFISLLHYKKLRKKHFLVEEGEVNNYINFVNIGILRIFFRQRDGVEYILQFAPSGWWIADVKSITTKKPGTLNIEAIEDSEVFQILKSDLDNLYMKYPVFQQLFRVLAENSLAAYQHLYVKSLAFSAKERFECFTELYPSLITRLPQKYIASFIGVTPEFFSKMLNQIPSK